MNIFYDINKNYIIDSSGARDQNKIILAYQSKPTWIINIKDVITSVDLSSGITWSSAVDFDFDSSTSPMVRVLNADIDSSEKENGIIAVKLDSDKIAFKNALGTNRLKNAYFELRGFDANGDEIYYFQLPITCQNKLDVGETEPSENASIFYNIAQVDAITISKVDKDISSYPNAIITGDKLIYVGNGEKTTFDEVLAYNASNLLNDETFSTSAVSDGIVSYTTGILTIEGTKIVAEIKRVDGTIVENLDNLITYGNTNTIIDLSGGEDVQQGTDIWTVRFSGGQNTETILQGIDKRSFNRLIGIEDNVEVIYMDDDVAYIDGTMIGLSELSIYVKSYSSSVTGNVVLQLISKAGSSETKVVVPVGLTWTKAVLTSTMTDLSTYAVKRLNSDVLDTLDAVSLLIMNPCEVKTND